MYRYTFIVDVSKLHREFYLENTETVLPGYIPFESLVHSLATYENDNTEDFFHEIAQVIFEEEDTTSEVFTDDNYQRAYNEIDCFYMQLHRYIFATIGSVANEAPSVAKMIGNKLVLLYEYE